jgi:hypothetical protein
LSVDWDVRGRSGVTAASLGIVYVMDNDVQQVLPVKLTANVVLRQQGSHSLEESISPEREKK